MEQGDQQQLKIKEIEARVLFWNMNGYRRNVKCILQEIKKSDKVCLCETWFSSEVSKISGSKLMKEFKLIQVMATKKEGRGRLSGGLILAYNCKVYGKLEEKVAENYIIALLESVETIEVICVCACYIQSNENMQVFWDQVLADLKLINENHTWLQRRNGKANPIHQ